MKTISLLIATGLCFNLSLQAQSAVFLTDASMGADDPNYDGQGVVVISCRVTIGGTHAFSDLLIVDN
jgi:hypothetical protein